MKRSKPSHPGTGGYRLHRQQIGARVTYWPDPRGPGHGEMYWGTVLEHMGDTVIIGWDDEPEFYENWDGKECRYRVDRGQMRFIPPPKERRVRLDPSQLTCKTCGRPRQLKCGCPRPGALKPEQWGQKVDHALLTPSNRHDMMDISIGGNAPDDMKGALMARKKAEAVAVVDELDDPTEVEELDDEVELEELDDATEATSDEGGSSDMLTAKAAASLLKTDGRTLRKFLRKKYGTIGQGKRWELDPSDLEGLRAEFTTWSKGGAKEEKAAKEPKAPKAAGKAKAPAPDPIYDADLEEFEEIEDLDFED